MTLDGNVETVDEAEIALARLRLFLAPHADSSKPNEGTEDSTTTDENPESRVSSSHTVEADLETQPPKLRRVKSKLDATSFGSASIRALPPLSKEFLRVKYLLEASVTNANIQDQITIWDMRNPNLAVQYEHHTTLELDSWVGVNDLGSTNCMQDVYSCGFQSPDNGQGLRFCTGNIILDDKAGRQQFVLCKIAVGRAYVVDKASDTKILPEGHNSFYIRQPPRELNEDERPPYYHEYVINDAAQILPQYLVQFTYSAPKKDIMHCALCDTNEAVVSCAKCEADLCSSCDEKVHNANKLAKKHKRVACKRALSDCDSVRRDREELRARVGKCLTIESKCTRHPEVAVEFYCPTCAIPVCVHCKMVGDHSGGENALHMLVRIIEAFDSSLEESKRSDPLIERRQTLIDQKLKLIEQRAEDIRANSAQVEEAIRKVAEQAIQSLKAKTETKLGTLLGEELELKRQGEQIEWSEKFLAKQRRTLGPVEFLEAWKNHKELRSQLRDFPVMHLSCIDRVKADIQLIGKMDVVTSSSLPGPQDDISENVDYRKKLLSVRGTHVRSNSISSTPRVLSPKGNEIIKKVKEELEHGDKLLTYNKQHYGTYNASSDQNRVLRRSNSRGAMIFANVQVGSTKKHRRHNTTIAEDFWVHQLRSEMRVHAQ